MVLMLLTEIDAEDIMALEVWELLYVKTFSISTFELIDLD